MTPDETGGDPAALAAALLQAPDLQAETLALAERAASGAELPPTEGSQLFLGLFALAARRETAACPAFLALLRLPHESLEALLGDAVENAPRLLLGLYDGQVSGLYALLADPAVEGVAKWPLFRTLAWLVWQGREERARFVALLARFDREELAPPDDLAWYGWQDAVLGLGLADLAERAQAGWEAGRLPEFDEVEQQDWLARLAEVAADPEAPLFFDEERIAPVGDLAAELAWLAESQSDVVDENDGLLDSERVWLAEFLASEEMPDEPLSLEELDGFFAALAVAPVEVPEAEWLPLVWSVEGKRPSFASQHEEDDLVALLRRYRATVAGRAAAGEPLAPLIAEEDPLQDGSFWAMGFLMGTSPRREAWLPLIDHPVTGEFFQSIVSLAGETDDPADKPLKPRERKQAIAALPAILQTFRAFRDGGGQLPRREPLRVAKVGRNEPCPCGSGKKYKKCCGAGTA